MTSRSKGSLVRKFHTALTDRQLEIVKLALLDVRPNLGVAEQELAETLKAFSKPETPETRVEHIPALLNPGDHNPIGFGTIAGDKLFIQIDNASLVDGVARLAQIGDITEIYLSMGFK